MVGISRFAQIALPLLFALALNGCATQAQSPPAPVKAAAPPPLKLCALPDAPPKEIASKPGYIQYVVAADDAAGKPIVGLKQSDFEVTVNDQPVPIAYFRDDKDSMPTSVVVIVDTSGSMSGKLGSTDTSKISDTRAGIKGAISNLDACDEIAVIVFGSNKEIAPESGRFAATVSVLQPFSTDHVSALSRIDSIQPFGQTPLYDSIDRAEHLLQQSHYPNRTIVLVTDGMDNSSETSRGAILDEATNDDVPLYIVGIGSEKKGRGIISPYASPGADDADRVDVDALQDLAQASAGHVWLVSSIDKDAGDTLVTALASAAQSVGRTYTIGFVAPTGAITKITTKGLDQTTYVHAHQETLAAR